MWWSKRANGSLSTAPKGYSGSGSPTSNPAGSQVTGGSGTLNGEVLHLLTGQPLGGATITVAGRSVVSDERGEFRLEGVPAGYLTVQAFMQGYRGTSQRVDLQSGGVAYLEFSLRPEGGH